MKTIDTVIQVTDLKFSVQNRNILEGVSLTVEEGEFVGIIGPNGSGKSTLLKNIYKVLTPKSGTIKLKGREIIKMSNRATSAQLAVVAQEDSSNFDFTVKEVVSMARYHKKKMLETLDKEDDKIIANAIEAVGMTAFINQSFLELSGGEKQRVLFARALAQQTEIVILDEPTNHLDIGSQVSLLRLMKNSGKSVLAALHDLAMASNYCDRIYVIDKGHIICQGPPRQIITDSLINKLYGIEAEVFEYKEKLFVDYA